MVHTVIKTISEFAAALAEIPLSPGKTAPRRFVWNLAGTRHGSSLHRRMVQPSWMGFAADPWAGPCGLLVVSCGSCKAGAQMAWGVSPPWIDRVKAGRSPPAGPGLDAVKSWQTMGKGLSNQHVEATSLVKPW